MSKKGYSIHDKPIDIDNIYKSLSKNLSILDLSHKNLRYDDLEKIMDYLKKYDITIYRGITTLFLYDNLLDELPKNLPPYLEFLDIRNNNIRTLDPRSLSPTLRTIIVSGNPSLEFIPPTDANVIGVPDYLQKNRDNSYGYPLNDEYRYEIQLPSLQERIQLSQKNNQDAVSKYSYFDRLLGRGGKRKNKKSHKKRTHKKHFKRTHKRSHKKLL